LILHEMKVRKVADLIELGYAGLVKNGRLSYKQIDGIDAAMPNLNSEIGVFGARPLI